MQTYRRHWSPILKIAFIDHYDSFSYNVLDWLQRSAKISLEIRHITCDNELALARLKSNPIPTVISPGPGSPTDYPLTLELLNSIYTKVPVLGICLGHQMLGHLAGHTVSKAQEPWHGTIEEIHVHHNNWFTAGLPASFRATVYHSLIVTMNATSSDAPKALHLDPWLALAFDTKKQLMMLSHRELPVASVQFHPESFGSQSLEVLAQNFLGTVKL